MKTIQRIVKYVIKNEAYENEFIDAEGDSFALYDEFEGLYLENLEDELCCFDTKKEAEDIVHRLIGTGLYEYNLSVKKLVDTVVLHDTNDKECKLDGGVQ